MITGHLHRRSQSTFPHDAFKDKGKAQDVCSGELCRHPAQGVELTPLAVGQVMGALAGGSCYNTHHCLHGLRPGSPPGAQQQGNSRCTQTEGPLHRKWSVPSACLHAMKPASWRKTPRLRRHMARGFLLPARDTVQLGKADADL